jgi:uncharacterized membrane protein HdeD (DUF308 family)
MTKALKVTMIVYGIIGILLGLVLVFVPDQMSTWFNAPALNDYEKYLSASIGLANIAAGVFIIMAARDPIKNISWVKFAIVWALFWVVTVVYGLVRGYVDFSEEGTALIINVIFAALFFAFYPWKANKTTS